LLQNTSTGTWGDQIVSFMRDTVINTSKMPFEYMYAWAGGGEMERGRVNGLLQAMQSMGK